MSAPAGDEDANGSSDYDEDDNCNSDNGGNDNCISDYNEDDNGNSDYDDDDDPEVVTMTKPGRAAPELLLQFVPTLYTSPTPLSGSIKEISSKIEIPNTRKHAKFTSLDDIITITTVIIIIIVFVINIIIIITIIIILDQ